MKGGETSNPAESARTPITMATNQDTTATTKRQALAPATLLFGIIASDGMSGGQLGSLVAQEGSEGSGCKARLRRGGGLV